VKNWNVVHVPSHSTESTVKEIESEIPSSGIWISIGQPMVLNAREPASFFTCRYGFPFRHLEWVVLFRVVRRLLSGAAPNGAAVDDA
jgi:hypothetical protein